MWRVIKYTIAGSALAAAGLIATYPELRFEGGQLAAAGRRLGRITATAIRMEIDYQGEITPEKHVRNGHRLFEALKKNGGAYIKCGQVIAQLDHIVPDEYCNAMKPMFAEAPRSSFEDVRQTIYEELGQPIEAVFKEFDREAVASASLGQVHRAVLMDGTEVAVKVQHRWIKRQYPGDAKVLEFLVRTGRWFFPSFDYMWIVDDMKLSMAQELDFALEARNATKCREIFKDDPRIEVPKVYMDLSTGRLLTMDFARGLQLTDLATVKANGIDFIDLASTLTYAFNEMIFVHGFVHCDPHPGNLLVKPVKTNGRTHVKLVLLDHGLYRKLTPAFLKSYKGMWRAIFSRDQDGMKQRAKELGVTDLFPLLASMMTGRSWDDIMDTSQGKFSKLRNARAFKEDKNELKKNVMTWRSEINSILQSIDNNFLLLFKTFDWLRALDAQLGAPVNSMESVADYCTREETSIFFRWILRIQMWLIGIYYRTMRFLRIN